MKLRGRRFLTRAFLFLTTGLVIILLVGNAYFVMAPSDALQQILAIPLVGTTLWIFYRFARIVALHHHLELLLRTTGITMMLGWVIRVTHVLPVKQLAAVPKKLWNIWSR